jgi:hypothetical protein
VILRGLAGIALAALTWGVACAPAADRQSQVVVDAFFDARNAHNEPAVRALLADDVIVRIPAGAEFRGSADAAQKLLHLRSVWEVWNVRAAGDTVVWMERETQDTPRLPNVAPPVFETEMQAVVLQGRIQSLSPTSLPLPRPTGAPAAAAAPPAAPVAPWPLVGLGLAVLAGGAAVWQRWCGARRGPKPAWESGQLLARLRPPRRPRA